MANDAQIKEREYSLTITIRIDRLPASEIAKLEEEASTLGDEWGAMVDINKGSPRGEPK